MKNKPTIFKRLLILCGIFATSAVFGQVTQTWTGGGDGVELGLAANWGGTLPSAANGDTGQFNNTPTGNLNLSYGTNDETSGFGSSGLTLTMTASQTGNVSIVSPVAASANLAILNLNDLTTSSSLTFGDNTAHVLNWIWRPGNANQVHDFVNNSTAPCVINSNVRIQSGGGVVHILLFDGSGNWNVTNNLNCANGAGSLIQKTGSGTLYWNGPSISAALGNATINSPITIGAGAVVLQNNTVLSPSGVGNSGSQNIVNNGTLFEYDAPSLAQTLTGVISGSGALQVNSGTLTLSGANTYAGSTTLSGGELVANSTETLGTSGPLGVGGTISFTGGTLGFSVNNTYDYSPRFSTAASQSIKIDTAGQNVTLTNALTSSGGTLTKLGSGTLTLSGANTYNGLTTVSAGKLLIQGTTGTGNITVNNSTTLSVNQGGAQIAPGALTVGTTSSATLEFNNVSSTTTAAIASGAVSVGGPITINVTGGSFLIGQHYPLLSFTGTAPGVTLGTLTGAGGNLSTNGNTIQLNVTSLAFVWTGSNNANWDTSTANDWKVNGISQIFANGGTALFDDTVTSANTNVILNSLVTPASVTVSASTKTYSITSSGPNLIGGTGGLTKSGSSTLTLAGGVNTYSGATTVSGGVLSVGTLANGSSASDIGAAGNSAANLVLNGGTLEYTGGVATSDHLFTLGTAGGTIDNEGGQLSLNNSGSIVMNGTGARILTLTGSNTAGNLLAASLADNGGATSLTKSGAGTWILTGTNTQSGVTLIASGGLQVGTGGASGAIGTGTITDNGGLDFDVSGTLTAGTISGTGTVTNDGSGTVILPGNNSYSGGTTINAGALQVGNGGATGTLNGGSSVLDNSAFIFNSTGSFTLSGVISGTGNLIVSGSGGLLQALGANTYSGWTTINPGATFQPCQGNQGALASSVVTNNGTLKLVRQDNGIFIYAGPIVGTGQVVEDANNVNVGDVTLTGTNTYTGGTIIANNTFILGDGVTTGAGTIVGDVLFTNSPTPNNNPRTIEFNHPESLTFGGNITYSTNLPFGNRGIVLQNGAGTLTLTGNNTYPGGTVISNGVVQVGAGGTSGSIGTGPINDNGVIAFDRSDAVTFAGIISGTGSVVQRGTGALTLTATNTYFGTMSVSNGTLLINGQDFAISTSVTTGGTLGGAGAINGPVTLNAGTSLAPGATVGAPTTLTINSSLSIGGNLAFNVNKSLSPSNDLVVVSGALNNTGTGTLTVVNGGPALAAGDKFTLFSQPVTGGAALTVTGGGATWTNNLAVDGSISVLSVAPTVNTNRPVLQVAVSGSTLSLAWPTNLGWTLQTNSIGLTAANQWFSYPGSAAVTNESFTFNRAVTNVFFRMVYTNTP